MRSGSARSFSRWRHFRRPRSGLRLPRSRWPSGGWPTGVNAAENGKTIHAGALTV